MVSVLQSITGLTFRTKLLIIQVAIVFITMGIVALFVNQLQERQFRDAYKDRMIAVAQSVATLPTILAAYDSETPSLVIQPIAEVIREASDVTYIVVTDKNGIRHSHPNPDRIGERVSTDPSVPLSGETFIGTETGTLGQSWRVKMPIYSETSEIIGTVSVGILESELYEDLANDRNVMWFSLMLAGLVGVLGSAWLAYYWHQKTYRLEPAEIATLLETREAVISGIREGIIAVDNKDRIVLINDAASRLLGQVPGADLFGKPIAEVLEPSLVQLTKDASGIEQLVLSDQRLLLARADQAKVNEDVIGSLIILRDHTELHQLLNQLDGAQSLAQGLRAQAHEFSNKLHVLSGLLELGRYEEALAFIERTGAGGAITGLSQEQSEIYVEIAALLLAKRARAIELGIKLSLTSGSRLELEPEFFADNHSGLVTDSLTILGNLIDNAFDAAGYGGSVLVSLSESDQIRIVVEDDGPGVPSDLAERIFEVGVTTKSQPSQHRESSRGIGLALIQRIVQKNQGTINLSRSELGGAKFEIVIPITNTLVTTAKAHAD